MKMRKKRGKKPVNGLYSYTVKHELCTDSAQT